MLKAAGSSELASVSALGWRSVAMRIKSVTHGTLHIYMSRPNAMMTARAAGMALPTIHMRARTAACTMNTTMLALSPNFSSRTPDSMFDTKRIMPYTRSTTLASAAVSPRYSSRYGVT